MKPENNNNKTPAEEDQIEKSDNKSIEDNKTNPALALQQFLKLQQQLTTEKMSEEQEPSKKDSADEVPVIKAESCSENPKKRAKLSEVETPIEDILKFNDMATFTR